MIELAERQKYEDAWSLPAYAAHSPGERYVPIFLDMAHPEPHARILDAGCGSGKGALALHNHGFRVQCCDFTRAGLIPEAADLTFSLATLWDDLRFLVDIVPTQWGRTTFDYVYCCDVMEHIPTALTMLVVVRLLEIAKHGVFLSISTVPDQLGAWIGQSLHVTVEGFVWWRDNLATVGNLVEARDLLNAGLFLVVKK